VPMDERRRRPTSSADERTRPERLYRVPGEYGIQPSKPSPVISLGGNVPTLAATELTTLVS
jgi:hypothetical protein